MIKGVRLGRTHVESWALARAHACTHIFTDQECSAVAEDSGASAPKHAHIQAYRVHPSRFPTMQRCC